MKQLDDELQSVKSELISMWESVLSQLNKTHHAMIDFDKDMAREVMIKETRINSQELKIDRDCENIFALFSPVAIDLRLVLAILKINNNLERTGDIADGIARFIIDAKAPFQPKLWEVLRMSEMFKVSLHMIEDVLKAFMNEDTKLARTIFLKDDTLDEINMNAIHAVSSYIQAHPEDLTQALHALSTIRKLERVGDQCKNIAEEIIFYIEAKVMKHQNRADKMN